MIQIDVVLQLHETTVARWHAEPVDCPYQGVYQLICEQHAFNFQLWHEEDIARSPDVSDQRIAQVKRNIDRLNEQRNDWIERVDEWLAEDLANRGLEPADSARQNTETPGSTIDRLSILALRLYHLAEQRERQGAPSEVRASVERKLEIGRLQRHDLATAAGELLSDIYSGCKRHRTYRQMKMYNDPNLNPYLYKKAV